MLALHYDSFEHPYTNGFVCIVGILNQERDLVDGLRKHYSNKLNWGNNLSWIIRQGKSTQIQLNSEISSLFHCLYFRYLFLIFYILNNEYVSIKRQIQRSKEMRACNYPKILSIEVTNTRL